MMLEVLTKQLDTKIVYAQEQTEETHNVILIATTTPIEQKIRDAFPEQPNTMLAIAKCESHMNPLAISPTHDYGIFQLNKSAHGATLTALNLDPLDVDDNIQFARMLYEKNGTRDWNMSKGCWNN